MGWFDAIQAVASAAQLIKDGASAMQKADNIQLVQGLIDAQAQIMNLVSENEQLKQKIKELEKQQDLEERIERHTEPYITLTDDDKKIIYCSCCWDTKHQLVQVLTDGEGMYQCPACKEYGRYDEDTHNE